MTDFQKIAGAGLDGGERDTLVAMFLFGPIWDGDVPSKAGRDGLVARGFACRVNGWQTLTRDGLALALELEIDRRKEHG